MSSTLPEPPSLSSLIAAEPVSLFLDFDGTLVEISATPDGIVVPPDLNDKLARLSARLGGRLALVSGRAVADIEDHLGALSIACAGSHGADVRDAENRPLGIPATSIANDVIAKVSEFARENDLLHESKPHGTAMHWRSNPGSGEAAEQFMGELAKAHGLTLKRGKAVAELVHLGTDKGAAVGIFLDQPPFRGAQPVFIGDDITDEDGFRAASGAGGFGILVGNRSESAAGYALADVAAVHQWLWA